MGCSDECPFRQDVDRLHRAMVVASDHITYGRPHEAQEALRAALKDTHYSYVNPKAAQRQGEDK